MKLYNVKITVLDTTYNEDLAKKYAVPGFGRCPINNVGDIFISEGGNKPMYLCDDAWNSIQKYVFGMAHGVEEFWPDWMNRKNVTVLTCPDGLRPVVFKVETLE